MDEDSVSLAELAVALEEIEAEREMELEGKLSAIARAEAAEKMAEESKKMAMEAHHAKMVAEAERDSTKAHSVMLEKMIKEHMASMEKYMGMHSDEMSKRSAAEARISALEEQLVAERNRPAPAPEKIMERVKEFYPMPEPVSDYKMTVNRGKDGKIIDVKLSPVKSQ